MSSSCPLSQARSGQKLHSPTDQPSQNAHVSSGRAEDRCPWPEMNSQLEIFRGLQKLREETPVGTIFVALLVLHLQLCQQMNHARQWASTNLSRFSYHSLP